MKTRNRTTKEKEHDAAIDAMPPWQRPGWRGVVIPWQEERVMSKLRPRQRPHFMGVICIPRALRNRPVAEFRMTGRLRNFMENWNVRKLGDLDGLRYTQMLDYRNCGVLTVREMKTLVEHLQHTALSGRNRAHPAGVEIDYEI